MARQLVESMSGSFKPDQYKDEFREKLSRAIRARLKRKGAKISAKVEPEAAADESSGKVVDFMARSEEHTSELQSLMRISYTVFCLKKKNNTQYTTSQHNKKD